MANVKIFFLFLSAFLSFQAIAQDDVPQNWFHLDPAKDGYFGVSSEKAYKDLLKSKKGKTIIVAVIDSGVDYEHEDLREVMWVNSDEIPGNGKDDDNNGYTDDIYGWNFIGGKNGKNIDHDTYELTRLYAKYHKLFKDANADGLSGKDKKQYETYLGLKEELEGERDQLEKQSGFFRKLNAVIEAVRADLGEGEIKVEDFAKVKLENEELAEALVVLETIITSNGISFKDVEDELSGSLDYFDAGLNYHFNPEFNPRAKIVGDNYADPDDRNYGNNDVRGPDSFHGTHVAGIIAASRNNGLGIQGVADNVRIMGVRAVPDGDERDKDVANAIIYAVDNGASVINMSFGKGYAWDKDAVDKAVKYARKHDVLLVHAAGNDGENNDTEPNFPNDVYSKKGLFSPKKADNWIEVGALSWHMDENAPASFSNYGQENVDVFAPGVKIYSTAPGQEYKNASGTSMASPVTAGVASLLRAYFPELSAKQVKEIIMASTEPYTGKVEMPGSDELVPFSELSVSGGVVNAYKAIEMASKTKGKRKKKFVEKSLEIAGEIEKNAKSRT